MKPNFASRPINGSHVPTVLFVGAFLASACMARAQTTLGIGDISITGFNSNAPDGFTFVLLRAVDAGTVIKFTDNGFLSSGSAGAASNGRGGESFATWTAPAGGLAAGAVVQMVNTSGSVTTVTGGGTAAQALTGISSSGDQIFVYQGAGAGTTTSNSDFGTNANPSTFTGTALYGLNFQSDWLTSGSVTSNTSYLPSQLSGLNANIALNGSTTSGKYTGATSGFTAAAFASAISNVTNWTIQTGAALTTLSTTGLSISSAANLLWDNNGSTAGTGGTGTWDVATTNKWSNSANNTFLKSWVNSNTGNEQVAVFAGTAGTVSIASGGVVASGLQFNVNGYTIQNNSITLTGTAQAIAVTNSGETATIDSVIAGSGFAKTGAGTLSLSGSNTFTGQLSVQQGTLSIASINDASTAGVLGNSTNSVSLGNSGGVTGTLSYTGGSAASTKTFTMATGGTGTFDVTTGATTLTLGGAINGSGNLIKTGAGTLALSVTSTYTGNTTVSDGKLVLNGNISTSLLTTVKSGGTLGGSGTIGALTVEGGGTLAPGNSPGILNAGNTSLQAASTLGIELNGVTAGTQYDQLNVTGSVSLAGLLSVTMTSYAPADNALFFVLLNDGTDAITGTFSNAPTNGASYNFGGQEFLISYFGKHTSAGAGAFTGGNDVVLMAVPEPAAAILGSIGLLSLLRRRR